MSYERGRSHKDKGYPFTVDRLFNSQKSAAVFYSNSEGGLAGGVLQNYKVE